MDDLDRLHGSDETRSPLQEPLRGYDPTSRTSIVGVAVLFVVVAIGLWWWARERPAQVRPDPPAAAGEVIEARSDTVSGLGIGAPDPNLPELGALDGYVRPLVSALSRRPELAALLASDDLVRRFVVSVEAVARGASPARQVQAVAPRGSFEVTRRGADEVIAPQSYARYAGLVAMVEDLEPTDLARLYGRLKPRLEQAHAELGVEGTFDETMARALRHLLQTPDLPPGAVVRPGKGANYAYQDAAFESLSPAQRQLLRLGPEQSARVKAHLRAFALALGMDASSLPPAT